MAIWYVHALCHKTKYIPGTTVTVLPIWGL